MSILAKNIKTIRKSLQCTQSAMSDILNVGFRTYVRYEAGERDAPVPALVKLSKLGNLSLEKMLTTEIQPADLLPVKTLNANATVPEVSRVDFQTGQIAFRKPSAQGLLTLDDSEKRLLTFFRKMEPAAQDEILKNLDSLGRSTRKNPRERGMNSKRSGRAGDKADASASVARAQNSAKTTRSIKKGRPGRKKLDKRMLQEKIDRLKLITRSIHKITVR